MTPALSRRMRDPDRLAAVRAILEAPSDRAEDVDHALQRISRLATALLGSPVSLVSLVTVDEQVFAAQVGLPEEWSRGTPISHSFCQHVVDQDSPLIVADAREHELVRDNPAIEDLDVIAYCGVPLRDAKGRPVGAFCVIDSDPRDWTEDEVALIGDLGQLAASELGRRAARLEPPTTDAATVGEIRRAVHAVLGGFRTVAAAGDLTHADRALYVAVVERHARHVEELLDRLVAPPD